MGNRGGDDGSPVASTAAPRLPRRPTRAGRNHMLPTAAAVVT